MAYEQDVSIYDRVAGGPELVRWFGRVPRPERRNLFLDAHPDDIELELEPCYGLDGLIRASSVSVTFTPGSPQHE